MASVFVREPNIVELAGEIDLHESPQLREAINPLVTGRIAPVLVDMTGVTYIDSSGLAVLIEAFQKVSAYGGKLILFGIQENVMAVFQIARLDQVFEIQPDKPAAIAG